MTEQEAIDYYNNFVIDTRIGLENICKTSDLINLSIKALEKQIPIKLNGNSNVEHCKCGNPIYYQTDRILHHYNYCCECGRKIKWE